MIRLCSASRATRKSPARSRKSSAVVQRRTSMGHHRSDAGPGYPRVGEYRRQMRQHWLLVRGTGDRPLAERVSAASLRTHSSTRRPSVQKGDLAVCYASVWQVLFALVEVAGDPENEPGRERWGWQFPIRPLLVLDDLREAPPVEAAG